MTKKISVLLAFVALLFAEFALAQSSAVVTSVVGTANVETGPGTPRALHVGDQVQQGDTLSTGAGSSLVLKFDDGEVTALTQNSRMTVTAYQYEPASQSGNMLLSLVTGGMRAITGLLGRNQPERVAYRAATATIGIRGTDATIVTDGKDVSVVVTEGAVTFTFAGQTITIPAGQAAFGRGNTLNAAAASAIFNQLPPGFQSAVNGLAGMTTLINNAAPGTPRSEPNQVQGATGTGNTPGTNVPPGGAGGGSASSF
jgi:hypothetical protein